MTRAISDVDVCVEGMRKFTTEIFDTGVVMVAYLVMLFIYDSVSYTHLAIVLGIVCVFELPQGVFNFVRRDRKELRTQKSRKNG